MKLLSKKFQGNCSCSKSHVGLNLSSSQKYKSNTELIVYLDFTFSVFSFFPPLLCGYIWNSHCCVFLPLVFIKNIYFIIYVHAHTHIYVSILYKNSVATGCANTKWSNNTPVLSKFSVMPASAGQKSGGGCGYIGFQSLPLHINNCSSSKDNSTQGTKSCQHKKIKIHAAQYS